MARVHDAVVLVDGGMSVADAAKQIGVTPQSVYAEMKKRELKMLRLKDQGLKVCPCCDGTGSVPLSTEGRVTG